MIRLNKKQREAVETIDRNVLVKAGAGAGKTAVLTERFINLIKKSKSVEDKEKILAITFTNKAVEEMRSRIVKNMIKLEEPIDFKLNVFTFDSFFKDIVEIYNPDKYNGFNMIEEYEVEYILKNIVKDIIFSGSNGVDNVYYGALNTIHVLTDSFDIDTSISDLVGLYNSIRNIYGRVDFLNIKSPNKNMHKFTYGRLNELSKLYYKRKNKLWSLIEKEFVDKDEDDIIGINDLYKISQVCSKDEILAEVQAASFELDSEYEEIYSILKEILNEVDKRYSKIKDEMFAFDFTDITLEATKCLLENIDELRNRYDFIMIDEFQDTSPLQMNFFNKLTDGFSINNTFVVGDIKQSIYRFRGADYSNIIDFEKEIIRSDGVVIELDINYRSKKEIVSFTNNAFEKIMSNYNSMNYYLEGESEIYNININEFDKNYVQNLINVLISKGYKYKDIGILSSSRRVCIEIEKYLKGTNIPFVNFNPVPLIERPETVELILILKLMKNMDDKFLLLSVLRGILFNLSDLTLSKIGLEKDFFQYDGDDGELIEAKNILLSLNKIFKNNTLRFFIDYLYTDLNFFSKCNTMWEFISGNNLLLVKKILLNIVETQKKSLNYAIMKLENDRDIESLNFFSKNEDAVHISTIHKSKGLEYKFVILPDLGKKRMSTYPKFLFKDMTLYVKLNKVLGSYHLALRDEKKAVNEEQDRLLYVALTRAMDKLFIVSEDKITPSIILSSIYETYKDFARDYNFINQDISVGKFNIVKNFDVNINIGEEINVINPSDNDLNVGADTRFGDFIHHYAEFYDVEKSININALIKFYKLEDIYDYEKIIRHTNNLIEFLKCRDGYILKEKNIVIEEDGRKTNAIIDRLEIKKEQVKIIDFKTVEVSDEQISVMNELYSDQMLKYRKLLAGLYKEKNIKSFIFYTAIGRLEEII